MLRGYFFSFTVTAELAFLKSTTGTHNDSVSANFQFYTILVSVCLQQDVAKTWLISRERVGCRRARTGLFSKP